MRTHHDGFLLVGSLSESEGEITDSLGDGFNLDRLVVGERVVLGKVRG